MTSWRDRLVDYGVVAVSAVLIFTRLGHYPFWGDEADTVIFGRTIWETGDMSAWYGDNLYAYRYGAQLEHLRNRSAPPLPFYLTAVFWGLAGDDRFWLRFPFAFCGVATVALMQHIWRRLGYSADKRFLLGGALALNVSWALYSRQCRYYALAAFLALLTTYLYATYDGSRKKLWALVAAACLLAATQFMNFAAVMAAILCDYCFWQRRRVRLSLSEWGYLLVPITVVFAALLYAYFPLGRELYPGTPEGSVLLNRMLLFAASLRDFNLCEYGVGLILVIAIPLGVHRGTRRGEWLISRLLVGGAVFLCVTTILSPQIVAADSDADVRYFMPLILPGVGLTVLVWLALVGDRTHWAAPLVALSTLTNVTHCPIFPAQWSSTFVNFVGELIEPRHPTTEVLCNWVDENVTRGSSIAVFPNEWIATTIVHAPHYFYGWQLTHPRRAEDYVGLDERLFAYRAPVDIVVALGTGGLRKQLENDIFPTLAEQGMVYRLWHVLDCYYDDRTRPELFWHWFREEKYEIETDAVYIFRLDKSPPPAS